MNNKSFKRILNELVQQNNVSYKASDDEVKKGINLNLPQGSKGFTVKKDPTGGYNINPTKESEMKEGDTNPWAVCTAQLKREFKTTKRSEMSPSQRKKFERCVKDVKKQKESLKEQKDSLSLFLENKIYNIVQKHIPPKITKRELMKYLHEQAPTIAPPKPKTEPKTVPSEPAKAPRPRINPGKNPFPNTDPKPKAISPERAKKELIDLIVKLMQNKKR